MILRALAVWLLIGVFAVANGALREAVLVPALGRMPAVFLSGCLLMAIVLAIAAALIRWMRVRDSAEALGVGLLWLVLTLAFEFAFGAWQGHTWDQMAAQYTFQDGNIWPLVLVAVMLSPSVGLVVRPRR